MKNNHTEEQKLYTGSIKQKFILFSLVFFMVIVAGGGFAFFLSMKGIIHNNKKSELSDIVIIQRITLESSVNGEIAIVMKMADSPLIKRYFQNPNDRELERIAFEEIAGYRRAFVGNTVFWLNDEDKRFHSDDAYVFTLDATDPDNYWYLMTLNETERYNFNINYNPDLDVTNLWINAPVFNENRRPIGILGTGIDLTAFVNSLYAGYTGTGELYFFNEAGEITGAKDASLIVEKVTLDQELGENGAKILDWVRENTIDDVYTFTSQEGEIAVSRVPALGWYVAVVQTLTTKDYLETGITFLFVSMIGVIALIFIFFNILVLNSLKPISGMVKVLNHISANWDLTQRCAVQRKDEIGNLANLFNETVEHIRGLLSGIKNETRSLENTGEDLASNMTETAAAINQIAANIQSMKNQVASQAGEVNDAGAVMERIMEGLDKLNEHIAVQAESVSQSSSAIEEMLANIRSVAETLIKNTGNINSLGDSSQTGRRDLQTVSQDIKEIARESEGLLEINSVMETIASQTNLLSMNAAIEAAHAGEAGKGFAVVAGEIRKLAENSREQSKTISEVLKKIKTSIDAITKSTDIVLERFEAIAGDVEIVSNQESQIRTAMEEQETGSRQILEAVGQLNSITGLVKSASSDMAANSKNVINQSLSLKRITEEVAGGMDEMTIGADQINKAVSTVNEISVKNKRNIDDLSRAIAKFKVE
ncbi:MAG: methyl-accepting chemotaxis protein [Treponema sp.]|nr:methyl-accepting chemotaxis protein [Treponema sp.]